MQICVLSAFEDSLAGDTGYFTRIYGLAKGLAGLGNEVCINLPGFETSFEKVDGFFVCRLHGIMPKKFWE